MPCCRSLSDYVSGELIPSCFPNFFQPRTCAWEHYNPCDNSITIQVGSQQTFAFIVFIISHSFLWILRVIPAMPYPTSPDRFISSRSTQEASLKSFHVSKPLSSKKTSALDDPFDALNSRRLRDPARLSALFPGISPRPPHRSRSARHNGSGGLDLSFSGPASQRRYASVGSVWNIGGLAPAPPGPIRAVDNGHGGITGSGTNAPMYTSKFFGTETPDQDLDRHERRIALALDIDQTNRILDIPQSPSKEEVDSPRLGRTKRKLDHVEPLPIWQNGQWVKERSLSRE